LLLVAFSSATAQLRDSFEGPQPTWSLREADCGVRLLAHERTYRVSQSGQASEHLRLVLGNGTFAYLAQPIGKAPVIRELQPSLFVKADKANVQLLARVVFPRSIDRGTGKPIASWLRGESYTDVGEWQKLTIRDVGQLVAREAVALRTQGRRDIDEREAFVDMIVINAYTGAGAVEIWLDDLEIQGYVNLDEENGPQIARRPADPNDPSGSDPSAAPSAVVQGSLLLARGRPLMLRAIQHQGEPLSG
jgi:hypothetical protein